MRNVDLYLRRAKDCSRFAREAQIGQVKTQFRAAAKAWKSLAAERLDLLQRELTLSDRMDGAAETPPAPKPPRRAPRITGAKDGRS